MDTERRGRGRLSVWGSSLLEAGAALRVLRHERRAENIDRMCAVCRECVCEEEVNTMVCALGLAQSTDESVIPARDRCTCARVYSLIDTLAVSRGVSPPTAISELPVPAPPTRSTPRLAAPRPLSHLPLPFLAPPFFLACPPFLAAAAFELTEPNAVA